MKKTRNLACTLLCIVAAIAALSSCLSSDNDEQNITPEEAKMIFNAFKGTYQGNLYAVYEQSGRLYKATDSVENVTVTIDRDTIVHIANVPDSLYAYLTNTEYAEGKKVKDALRKHTATQPVRSKITTVGFADRDKRYYQCFTNYFTTNITANYDSQSHQLTFNNAMSCWYNPTKSKLQLNMSPVEIKSDKNVLRPSGIYFVFLSKTKRP